MRLWATDGHRSEAESPSIAKNGTIVQTRSSARTVFGIVVVVGLSQFFGVCDGNVCWKVTRWKGLVATDLIPDQFRDWLNHRHDRYDHFFCVFWCLKLLPQFVFSNSVENDPYFR